MCFDVSPNLKDAIISSLPIVPSSTMFSPLPIHFYIWLKRMSPSFLLLSKSALKRAVTILCLNCNIRKQEMNLITHTVQSYK